MACPLFVARDLAGNGNPDWPSEPPVLARRPKPRPKRRHRQLHRSGLAGNAQRLFGIHRLGERSRHYRDEHASAYGQIVYHDPNDPTQGFDVIASETYPAVGQLCGADHDRRRWHVDWHSGLPRDRGRRRALRRRSYRDLEFTQGVPAASNVRHFHRFRRRGDALADIYTATIHGATTRPARAWWPPRRATSSPYPLR